MICLMAHVRWTLGSDEGRGGSANCAHPLFAWNPCLIQKWETAFQLDGSTSAATLSLEPAAVSNNVVSRFAPIMIVLPDSTARSIGSADAVSSWRRPAVAASKAILAVEGGGGKTERPTPPIRMIQLARSFALP